MSDEQDSAGDGTSDESQSPAEGAPAGDTPGGDTPAGDTGGDVAAMPDPEAGPPPEVSAGSGAASMISGDSLPEALLDAVGDGVEHLVPLARRAAEALAVAVERASGQRPEIQDSSVTVTDYSAIEEDFAGLDHAGFELRVALTDAEAQLAAVLIPMDDAGALLGVDTSAEQMAAEDSAEAQLEAARAAARELLDLFSLTLFAGGPPDAEVMLSELRRGQVDYTLGMVADVAQGAPPLRLDIGLLLPDGRAPRLTAVVPVALLARLVELMPAPEGEGREEAAAPAVDAEPALPEAADPGVREMPPGVTAFPGAAGVPANGAAEGAGDDAAPVHPVRFPPLDDGEVQAGVVGSMDLIMDVSMRVTVELGRSSMTVEEVLGLGPGSVVELNKLAGEPVDILVNEYLIARGEVVVVDENFGVRVTEIVSPRSRARVMG